MERIKTGIAGFDELIQGGIPEGFNVLVTGAPGTGKTIFGLQYLYNGAMKGQNGVYIEMDTPTDSVKPQSVQFGWDLDALEKQGKLSILKIPLNKSKVNLFEMIEEAVSDIKAKRLVFDSLAAFAINIDQFVIPLTPNEDATLLSNNIAFRSGDKSKKYRYEVMPTFGEDPKGRNFYSGTSEKRITYLVIDELSKLGTTNIIITDAKEGDLTLDGVSEFVSDGVVHLHAVEGEEAFNTLNILKMRMTKVKRGIYNFSIGKDGILLKG